VQEDTGQPHQATDERFHGLVAGMLPRKTGLIYCLQYDPRYEKLF